MTMAGQADWYLVSNCGTNIALPQTMISLGREACDVILQSKSVDKRHAVITYDHYEKRFKVKDLNSINGTYLNNARVPSHTFVKVEQLDWLRFGFDPVVYQVQLVERFSDKVVGTVDYRRLVGGWPAPTTQSNTIVQRPTQFLPPPPPMKMADCRDCQQKQQHIRHTSEMKDHEWDDRSDQSHRALVGQDYCGNIMSHATSVVVPVTGTVVTSKRSIVTPTSFGSLGLDAVQSGTSCDCSVTPNSTSKSVASPPPPPPLGSVYRSPETSSHSLKSTFSGDSLDLMCNAGGIVSLAKKHPDGIVSNIVKAEKPYGTKSAEQPQPSSSARSECAVANDMRAPSFCPQSAVPNAEIDSADSPMTGTGRGASVRPPSCTAFTIDFVGDRPAATKKLDIRDSISKFAPPKSESAEVSKGGGSAGHRRNVSLSKVEEIKGRKRPGDVAKTETSESLGSNSMANSARLRLAGNRIGYMSEGHLSSDQDDNVSAKSDPSRRGSAKLGNLDTSKFVSEPERPPRRVYSAGTGNQSRHSQPATELKDSARYLINRMFGEQVPSPQPLTLDAKMMKSDSANVIGSGRNERSDDDGGKMSQLTKNDRKTGSHSSLTSTATYDIRGEVDGKPRVHLKAEPPLDEAARELNSSDEVDDDDDDDDGSSGRGGRSLDDVSESGTYTIDKDGDDGDEVEARKNIDKTFGVGESENLVADVNRTRHDETSKDEDANVFEGVELRRKSAACESETKRKNEHGSVKATPNWLRDWVHNTVRPVTASEVPVVSVSEASKSGQQDGSTGHGHCDRIGPVPMKSASGDLPPQRPRRKLPVLPVSDNATTILRSVASFSSPERAQAHSISPDGLRSDSSMDTETILKDTESVVSAMEARMIVQRDKRESRKNASLTVAVPSMGSRDSGGESDVDTSAASPVQHRDFRRLNAKPKIQSSSDVDGRKHGYGDYGVDNASEVETASIHSDVSTSSDLSGSSPGSKRKTDGSPVMRFNRAFSLRRARLACESDGGGGVRSAPNSKRLNTPVSSSRPNSASSATSNKDRVTRRPPSSNKSDGGGSSKIVCTPATAAKTGNSFGRNDGGRFSLRLPRSAPIPNRTQLAAAKVPPAPKNQAVTSKATQKGGPKGTSNARCNSTLTSKELELKNWRRRKEYDPLKAAAEGRKKEAAARKGTTTTAPNAATAIVTSKSETASPTGMSFQRSASFHGTEGLDVQAMRETFIEGGSFEDDDDVCRSQFNGRSPTSADKFEIPPYDNSESIYRCRNKKNSEDDSASEATRTLSHTDLAADDEMNTSPRGSPIQHAVLRHKSKIDALDNLVISTIHQLSSNLRGTTVDILHKIGDVHAPECEQVFGNSGLEDLMAKLGKSESPVSSPPRRTVSRQLAGILKNVKRLEESLQSIDRVLDLVPAVSTDGNRSDHEKLNGGPQKTSLQPTNKWNGFQGGNYY